MFASGKVWKGLQEKVETLENDVKKLERELGKEMREQDDEEDRLRLLQEKVACEETASFRFCIRVSSIPSESFCVSETAV